MEWISNFSFDSAYCSQLDQFSHRLGVFDSFDGVLRGGLLPEIGEVVPVRDGRKRPVAETKATVALKNHSEAERRRRGRINAHLGTLRDLVPCTDKMDKAALLAKVINQVKELKKNSIEASKGILIPTDTNELQVEQLETKDGKFTFMASICCNYRPDLLPDLKQAIDDLHLTTVKAEISTLGDYVKAVFVFTTNKQDDIANSIRQALSSVLDKASTSLEYSPRITLMNKRRRYHDSTTSSL